MYMTHIHLKKYKRESVMHCFFRYHSLILSYYLFPLIYYALTLTMASFSSDDESSYHTASEWSCPSPSPVAPTISNDDVAVGSRYIPTMGAVMVGAFAAS